MYNTRHDISNLESKHDELLIKLSIKLSVCFRWCVKIFFIVCPT
jgi:hypothetical protein